MRGHLITFEGIDRSGKTTQSQLLFRRLFEMGYDVILTHEPGDTQLGKQLRAILLSDERLQIMPVAELLMFMADRAQHQAEIILPALNAGRIIVCDRYIDTTIAYQGYGRGLDIHLIDSLHKIANGVQPDLTFLLDVDPVVALHRYGKGDRFESEAQRFYKDVSAGFSSQVKKFPERIFVIPGNLSIQEAHSQVWKLVSEHILEVLPLTCALVKMSE